MWNTWRISSDVQIVAVTIPSLLPKLSTNQWVHIIRPPRCHCNHSSFRGGIELSWSPRPWSVYPRRWSRPWNDREKHRHMNLVEIARRVRFYHVKNAICIYLALTWETFLRKTLLKKKGRHMTGIWQHAGHGRSWISKLLFMFWKGCISLKNSMAPIADTLDVAPSQDARLLLGGGHTQLILLFLQVCQRSSGTFHLRTWAATTQVQWPPPNKSPTNVKTEMVKAQLLHDKRVQPQFKKSTCSNLNSSFSHFGAWKLLFLLKKVSPNV